MQIQIHCPKCNRTERIEKEHDSSNNGIPVNKIGIPIPNFNNGLETFSIVHPDHTLILDIDHNGDVRGEKIIERIDRNLEKTLATLATKILELYVLKENKPYNTISFFFITHNRLIHKLLLSVYKDLIFNLPKGTESLSSVKYDEAILEYNGLTVYVGGWDKKIYNFRSDRMVAVYELDENSAEKIKLFMKKDQENGITDSALMFHSDFISTSDGKSTMSEIFQITSPQALDISSPERAAYALYSIIGSSLI